MRCRHCKLSTEHWQKGGDGTVMVVWLPIFGNSEDAGHLFTVNRWGPHTRIGQMRRQPQPSSATARPTRCSFLIGGCTQCAPQGHALVGTAGTCLQANKPLSWCRPRIGLPHRLLTILMVQRCTISAQQQSGRLNRAHNTYRSGIASGVGRQDTICNGVEIRRTGVLSHAGHRQRLAPAPAQTILSTS